MKHKVGRFLKEYRIREISSASLTSALLRQGFTVLKFNRLCNDEDLDDLIDALKLRSYIASSKGFTYANADHRLVFVHEELSEKETCMVLAHEQGHIYCAHTEKQPILGEDVRQENEANEFAHHLLHPSAWQKTKMWVRRNKVLTVVLASVLALAIIGGGVFAYLSSFEHRVGDYYLTETGTKYHTAECGFVKDRDTSRKMTQAEYESGLFTPCTRCLPEG